MGGGRGCWMMRFDAMRCDGSRGGEKAEKSFQIRVAAAWGDGAAHFFEEDALQES